MDRYLNDREELGRVTLIIPVELKERAADHARRKGMSLAALIRALIIRELRRIGAMPDERQ